MAWVYGEKDFRKKYLLSFELKRVEVMDSDSGEDELRQLGSEE